MEVKLNDGRTLSGYTYTEEDAFLKIRFIGQKIEDLREAFTEKLATKKIEIDGKVFSGYEPEYIAEYIGRIIEVALKKPEQTQEDTGIMQAVVELAKIQAQQLDDEEAQKVKELFPTWDGNGVNYEEGQRLVYSGTLYSVIQAHTSQAEWDPEAAASLFRKLGDPEAETREWIQPTGGHDAYAAGDEVIYEGKKYKSLVDGNVWVPGVYGWEEI